MVSRVPGVIVAGLLLLPAAASSQTPVGIARVPGIKVTRDAPASREAAPPPPAERHRHTRVPLPGQFRDLFLAPPDTYAPQFDRLPHGFHQQRFPRLYSGYGSYGGYGSFSDFYVPSQPMLASLPSQRMLRVEPDGLLQLVVEPQTAEVYVDGFFVGTVAEFNGSLAPGPHRVGLRAHGFDPVTFDVRLFPNEIVTYRNRMTTGRPIKPAAPLPARSGTIYVIPRCYAGDAPPEAAQLPAGCDLANLRRVPVS